MYETWLGLQNGVLSHVTRRNLKTKLQIYTEPQPCFIHFVGSSRAFSSLHSKPCLSSPVNVTPLFNSQRWGGAFFIDSFLRLYYTEHTLWLALDVGCKCGLAMYVRGMQNGLLPQCGEQFSFIL